MLSKVMPLSSLYHHYKSYHLQTKNRLININGYMLIHTSCFLTNILLYLTLHIRTTISGWYIFLLPEVWLYCVQKYVNAWLARLQGLLKLMNYYRNLQILNSSNFFQSLHPQKSLNFQKYVISCFCRVLQWRIQVILY